MSTSDPLPLISSEPSSLLYDWTTSAKPLPSVSETSFKSVGAECKSLQHAQSLPCWPDSYGIPPVPSLSTTSEPLVDTDMVDFFLTEDSSPNSSVHTISQFPMSSDQCPISLTLPQHQIIDNQGEKEAISRYHFPRAAEGVRPPLLQQSVTSKEIGSYPGPPLVDFYSLFADESTKQFVNGCGAQFPCPVGSSSLVNCGYST